MRIKNYAVSAIVALLSFGLAVPAQALDANELNNGKLRFGDGDESSVDNQGLLKQPWYWSDADETWYPLTYDDGGDGYPIDMAFGYGTDNTYWNGNSFITSIEDDNLSADSVIVDNSGITAGAGTLVTTSVYDLQADGTDIEVENRVLLSAGASFVKIETTVTNLSGAPLENFYIWVGTSDDWVGDNDDPDETIGNLTNGAFVPAENIGDSSNAIQITSASEGALFYSTAEGVATSINDCCSFNDAVEQDPATSEILVENDDNSYSLSFGAGDLADDASFTLTWFYAGGATDDLNQVFQEVAAAAGAYSASPRPYVGPLVTNLSLYPVTSGSTATITAKGSNLGVVTSATCDGKAVTIVSSSPGELVLLLPELTTGIKDLLMVSSYGRLTHQDAFKVMAAPVVDDTKVNAGSFKGYVAVYAKGYEGHRLSAKVGKDWVIVPSIPAATNDLYRHVEFTGAGVDVAVRIYIDRVLVDTINLTTK